MTTRRLGKANWVALVLLILLGTAVMLVLHHMHSQPTAAVSTPASSPATSPSTAPFSRPSVPPPPPKDLLGLVRANDPKYPTTQELDIPANYEQAAHVVLDEPVYLCPLGHLWITDPRGRTISSVLQNPTAGNSHVVSDRVVFVHWQLTSAGKWVASAVCRVEEGLAPAQPRSSTQPSVRQPHPSAIHCHLVQAKRTIPLPANRNWLWDRAFAWDDRIVVPTDRGVSVLSVNDPSNESFQSLIDDPSSTAPSNLSTPVVLFDASGIIAWMPWESAKTGSRGAARFADGKWTRLDSSQGWPDKILQLIPLLDGSVLQMIPNDDGSVQLQMSGIARESAKVDEAEIQKLVEQLSDPDQVNRDAAYEQLTRYGPGIFPILQKLEENQPPAAQGRIDELLKAKLNLTLGPITLQAGPVVTAERLRDGGVVLYCDAGVSVARGSDTHPNLIAPAWLSIRPGYPVQVLSTRMTGDLSPGKQKLFAFKGEWVVGDDTQGLRWFVGNYFAPLEHKDEYRFDQFVGIDSHGRWIMQTSQSPASTLIVDPNLPDPTPRLPVWVYHQAEGPVGWTSTNWPAVKPNGVAVLDIGAWREPTKDEKFYEHVADMPSPPPTTAPTAVATTGPATTREAADLILADTDGTRYYDGSNTIRAKTRDGKEITWNLPPSACGTGDVWLFHCGEDRFFLFNQPGRVLRLRRTPDAAEPFELEATFTHNIPSVDNDKTWIDRIWLDPAGRLVIAYNGNTLAILFPSGRIPSEIRQMMPPQKDEE